MMVLEIAGITAAVAVGVALLLYVVQILVPHRIRQEHNEVISARSMR